MKHLPAIFVSCLFLASGLLAAQEEWARPDLVREVLEGKQTEARVSWWGFDPEDSTRFLQSAISSGAKVLIVDRQPSPWITRPLEGRSQLELVFENGAVLEAKSGEFRGKGDCLLRFRTCENVVVRSEKATGADSREEKAVLRMRKADYHTDAYEKAEWRHGLSFLSCKNVRVEDLLIEYTGGDGIYLGVALKGQPCENVVIRRVDCNENNRQGISVISARNLLIEDTILRNTRGTAPQAGIDFEPNHASEELVGCVMRRCVSEGNAGDGFEFYLKNLVESSTPVSIVLEDCISRQNLGSGFHYIGGRRKADSPPPLRGNAALRGFRSQNDARGGIQVRGNTIDSTAVEISNAEIIDSGAPDFPAVVFRADPTDDEACGNVHFENVVVKKTASQSAAQPTFRFYDTSLKGYGLAQLSGAIRVEDGGSVETLPLTTEWLEEHFPTQDTRRLPTLPIETESLVPVSPGAEESDFGVLRARNGCEIFFYAQKGEKILFEVAYIRVGRSEAKMPELQFLAPDGEKIPLENMELGETKKYEVVAPVAGIYTFRANGMPHSFLLKSANVPTAFNARQLQLISTVGTCYFYVPEGTKEFGLKIAGQDQERVGVLVEDPAGVVRFAHDGIDSLRVFYPEGEPTPGVWKLTFKRPDTGVLEDFSLSLQAIPPLVSPSPAGLLKIR
ncbi:MAG: right-handed parallel beta-helix repeat-containing protein [Planctomycetia bacterium]|nr:right-handed parallel beta-helix repeat-containing protein [Planctomycetia bacterium]